MLFRFVTNCEQHTNFLIQEVFEVRKVKKFEYDSGYLHRGTQTFRNLLSRIKKI